MTDNQSNEKKPSVGESIIKSLEDFCQTLERGEHLGVHYKIVTRSLESDLKGQKDGEQT